MQPSTAEATEDRQSEPQPEQAVTAAWRPVACAVAVVVLMLSDMAAPVAFVPVQMRILAVCAVMASLDLYLDKRRDDRNQARHEEQLRAIRERNREVQYIEGYVDGLRRQMPPEEHGGSVRP